MLTLIETSKRKDRGGSLNVVVSYRSKISDRTVCVSNYNAFRMAQWQITKLILDNYKIRISLKRVMIINKSHDL